jgi:hypothetical protein
MGTSMRTSDVTVRTVAEERSTAAQNGLHGAGGVMAKQDSSVKMWKSRSLMSARAEDAVKGRASDARSAIALDGPTGAGFPSARSWPPPNASAARSWRRDASRGLPGANSVRSRTRAPARSPTANESEPPLDGAAGASSTSDVQSGLTPNASSARSSAPAAPAAGSSARPRVIGVAPKRERWLAPLRSRSEPACASEPPLQAAPPMRRMASQKLRQAWPVRASSGKPSMSASSRSRRMRSPELRRSRPAGW